VICANDSFIRFQISLPLSGWLGSLPMLKLRPIRSFPASLKQVEFFSIILVVC
jgi:hypothetical protein